MCVASHGHHHKLRSPGLVLVESNRVITHGTLCVYNEGMTISLEPFDTPLECLDLLHPQRGYFWNPKCQPAFTGGLYYRGLPYSGTLA